MAGSDADGKAFTSSPSAGSQHGVKSGESTPGLLAPLNPGGDVGDIQPTYRLGRGRRMSLDQGDMLIGAPSYRRKPSRTSAAEGPSGSGIQTPPAASEVKAPFPSHMSFGENSSSLRGNVGDPALHSTLNQPFTSSTPPESVTKSSAPASNIPFSSFISLSENIGGLGGDMASGYIPIRTTLNQPIGDDECDIGADMGYIPLNKTIFMNQPLPRRRYR